MNEERNLSVAQTAEIASLAHAISNEIEMNGASASRVWIRAWIVRIQEIISESK